MVLSELPKSVEAQIINMQAVDETVRQRLLNLGVKEGAVVKIIRALPFNGPVIIGLQDQLIGLRKKEARQMEVSIWNK